MPSSPVIQRPGAASGPTDHTVPLGDTGWRVWRSGLLRAAGFPVDGLERFADADLAEVADAVLGEPGADRDSFDKAFGIATMRLNETVYDIAGDPLFREAVAWQNPVAARTMLDAVLRRGPAATRTSSRREKEIGVTRYWARYCGKNDTIGFFGPVCWVDVTDADVGVVARPGPSLVRARRTYLERWALAAVADKLAAEPAIRAWLPPKLQPMLVLADGGVVHPTRGRLPIGRAEAAVLAVCDGRRPATEVARLAVADVHSGLRREQDALLALESLVEREILIWALDLPLSLDAEKAFGDWIDGVGDPTAQATARTAFGELTAGRERLASAAGEADAVLSAMDGLAGTFSRLAGQPASRAHGQMYAGRTVCFEDTDRDLDVVVGRQVLDVLAPPLSLLLISSRWLTTELARVFDGALHEMYEDLGGGPGAPVPLNELWYLAQGLFYGSADKPADAVSADFTRRWSEVLGLDDTRREVRHATAELAERVTAAFPADRPGWAYARYHSPDVHILAASVEAIAAGEFAFALGEMHTAWSAMSSELFLAGRPDLPALREHVRRDTGAGRLHPLLPDTWPRLTARTNDGLRHPDDPLLGFMPAPGANPDRVLPVPAFSVSDVDGELVATAPDGRSWPLVEVFGGYLSSIAVDTFKLLGSFRHSPRASVDRLVVARESWRRELTELSFATVKDERERYLAVRAWRAELGLPDRVFVKLDSEIKPFYVDLTSVAFVNLLCRSIRSAMSRAGTGSGITIIEMLPTPEQAWVPDRAGRRYASELRLQAVDPEPALWTVSRWT